MTELGVHDLATVPDTGALVVLPPTYIAARIALAKCDRIDECQRWANQATAMQSYAQQAQDETLSALANRIRARAVRRCGELLKLIPANPGGHGCDIRISRHAVAKDAGLTRLQRIQAIQVANIPTKKFEAIVESDQPPKIYKLAAIGRRARGPSSARKGLTALRRDLDRAQLFAQIQVANLAGALDWVRNAKAALAKFHREHVK